MPSDPQTLFSESKCYLCLGLSEAEALELALLARIAGGNTPPPPPTPPAAPTNIDITDASTAGHTILTWSNSDAPTTNEIWKSVNGGASALYASVGGGVHTYTDVAAMPANDFWTYKVRATTGALSSGFTSTVSAANGVNGTGGGKASLPDLVQCYAALKQDGDAVSVAISMPLLRKIRGTWDFTGSNAVVSVSVPKLTGVDTSIFGQADAALTTFNAPLLVTIGGDFMLNQTNLTNLTVTSLVTVAGNFFFYLTPIVTASFPALITVGTISFGGCPNITSCALPVLQTCNSADLSFDTTPNLASLSCPQLQSIAGSLNGPASGCASISMPVLNTIGADLQLHDCPGLQTVNFTGLQFISGQLVMYNSVQLVALNLPNFQDAPSGINCSSCASLATLTLTAFVPHDSGQTIDFSGCALTVGDSATQTGVDGVLRAGAAQGLSSVTFDLSGGTNATPSATGQADKALLILNGCTVTTN